MLTIIGWAARVPGRCIDGMRNDEGVLVSVRTPLLSFACSLSIIGGTTSGERLAQLVGWSDEICVEGENTSDGEKRASHHFPYI